MNDDERIVLGNIHSLQRVSQGNVSHRKAEGHSPIEQDASRAPDRRLYLAGPAVTGARVAGTVDRQIAPGVTIRAQGEGHVAIAQIGTDDEPVWMVTPGPRRSDGTHDRAGAIPLLVMAASKVAQANKKHKEKKEAEEAAKAAKAQRTGPLSRQGSLSWLNPFNWIPRHAESSSVSGFWGEEEDDDDVEEVPLRHVGYDDLGAILVDTDGKRVVI